MNTERPGNLQYVCASVFVFGEHTAAESAVRRLGQSGFARDQLSLVGKVGPGEVPTDADLLSAGRSAAALGGGVWDLLTPAAVLTLPGLGLVGMTGPLRARFLAASGCTTPRGGLSTLTAALVQVGVAGVQARCSADALKLNPFLLVVHGQARRQITASPQLCRPWDCRWKPVEKAADYRR